MQTSGTITMERSHGVAEDERKTAPDVRPSWHNSVSGASLFATWGLQRGGGGEKDQSAGTLTPSDNTTGHSAALEDISSPDRSPAPTSTLTTTQTQSATASTLDRSESTSSVTSRAGRDSAPRTRQHARRSRDGTSSGGRRVSAQSVILLDYDDDDSVALRDVFGFGSSRTTTADKTGSGSRTGLLKDEVIPRSTRWALVSGMAMAILQTLFTMIFASITTASLATLEQIILKSGGSFANSPYEYLPSLTLLLFSCLGTSLFCFWIYLSAVSAGNQIELIGHAILVLFSMPLSGLLTAQALSIHSDYQTSFPNLNIHSLNDRVRNIVIANSVLNVVGGVAWVLVDVRLYLHLGWRIYWRYGADLRSKLRQSFVHVFHVSLKLTSLVLVLNVFYFSILVVISGKFFLYPSTAGMYLFIFVTGAGAVYLVGSIAATQYSPAFMIFFCLATCVEIIPLVQCAYALLGLVAESPTTFQNKALPFVLIPQIVSIILMSAMVVIGGINTYLFFKYPLARRKERQLSNVEWTLA
ncbi:hypothetical protein M427DRAFT_151956 [Gonapodya prolifera JEL478]|uniref:Transmembrane protein n=1 Tax=Gonapodya prolifera (strain JEL478) TaxID=1344416 RepID=A0A139ATD3_GONPJ|nr:hypothetical protein M427DRAFT_151956 [Gonapodya prolifera JEL478]|eukprot:KXS19986.1 hypothetical protein M427DRAFT_151956 [Gonapodya prolifera JEL478]